MVISETCIKRPVFATVINLMVLLLGVIAFTKLQLRGVPDIDIPLIQINSTYQGASPDYMEKNVTTVIEKAIRSTKDIDFVSSSSGLGYSHITVFFDMKADINDALNDIRSKLADLSHKFPDDMPLPTASKQDPDSFPCIWIVATSEAYDRLELTYLLNSQVINQLERIGSVGSAVIYGGDDYTMNIKLDPSRLYGYKIAPYEIEQAIKAQNRDYPGGFIRGTGTQFSVILKTALSTAQDFRNIVLKTDDQGNIIKLGDVAQVDLEARKKTRLLQYNKKPAVAIGIIKQSKSNIIELSKEIKEKLIEVKKSIPSDVKLDIVYNQATPIDASISSVFHGIIEAIVLVFVTIYLFLKSGRLTLIPFTTIPLSLIGALCLMHWCGFSINTFTLLAMILAIGLVVDDAIVVLENAYRYCEQGLDKFSASMQGIKEIGFAILSMTTTLAAVFLPIGFLDGFVGKLFAEFAWTLAFAVIISGFVAITLTPMLCSKMISINHNPPAFVGKFSVFIDKINQSYGLSLANLIKRSKLFWLGCATSVFIMVFAMQGVDKVFAPQEDDGVLQLFFSTPSASSIETTATATGLIEEAILGHECVQDLITATSAGNGFGFIVLKDWSDRSKSQVQITNELNQKLVQIAQAYAHAAPLPSVLSGPVQKAIEFSLESMDGNIKELDELSQDIVSKMSKYSYFTNPDRNFDTSTPTIKIVPNKDKAYMYGVRVEDIGYVLRYFIAGSTVGDFMFKQDIYDVFLGYDYKDMSGVNDISKIYVKNQQGIMTPLSAVTEITNTNQNMLYTHYNGFRSISINSGLEDSTSPGEALKTIRQIAQEVIGEKANFKIELQGNLKRMEQQSSAMLLTFVIALLFIYLVLSAQFESFTDGLIIMCAVPFAIVGGIVTLFVFQDSLNLYSNIGLITLIGLITKNSIMLVEFANQRVHALSGAITKESIIQAVVDAARIRFRPIMMTTACTMLGALPLTIATGSGAAARSSIGLVVVGGMLFGTLFTMYVIPNLYIKFSRLCSRRLNAKTNMNSG